MARSVSNPSDISNNDLVLLRKGAKKYTKVLITAGTKKFAIEGTNVSVVSSKDGLSFISVPATNVILRNGTPVTSADEVKAAIKTLKEVGRKSGGSASKRSTRPELPEELRKQLEAFSKANNSRVIIDPSNPGGYKVQKLRPRPKK